MKNTHSISWPSRVLNNIWMERYIFNFTVEKSKYAMLSTLKKGVVKKRTTKICAALLAVCSSNLLHAASCDYAIIDEWGAGFKTEVSITNDSDTAINDWELSWSWTDGSSFSSGWQASFNCSGSSCTASAPPWSSTIGANQTYVFGFIADKAADGVVADDSIVLSGDICGVTLPTPTPTPVPTPTSVPTPVPTPVPTSTPLPTSTTVLWTLDGGQSSVQYVSMKNDNTAEINSFTADLGEEDALTGSVDSFGNAILAIDLNDVQTNIDIRNERMANFVFETELLPTAYVTLNLDTDALADMPVGTRVFDSLLATLSLHGVSQVVIADVLIVKRSPSDITVTTVQPINIDSKSFDLASGIEVLRGIAGLSSIGQAVPVYFRLHYVANTDDSVLPVAMAQAPAAPSLLMGTYDALSALAGLNWQDNSDDEDGFILRRKTITGLWQTVANVLSDVSSYSEGLPDIGEFDYKVIALKDGVTSVSSNIATVTVTEADSLALGKAAYDEQCAACHGPAGGGIGNFPAINTPRDIDTMIAYIASNMPIGNPGACDTQCAEYVAEYIQTLWVEEISCDRAISPVSYGARQLKILTQSEYQHSVEDLLGVDFNAADGLSADAKVGFFFNNTHSSVVATSYSNYLIVAEEVAQWSAANNFAPALNCTTPNQDCADEFIGDLAPKIFRRPLDSTEISTYSEMANGSLTSGDVSEGIAMALEAMLSSPQFLYRHELGEPNPANSDIDGDAFELTSYEMATFLAYTFTGSTPDDILLAAAANDELRDEANILDQAVRLTSEDGAKNVMGDFVGSWLGTADLDIANKDDNVWPGFTNIVPHMQNEIREMFANVMLDPNESFSSFYTADYTFVNEALAAHYGIQGVSGSEMQRVATTDRGGILANGAFMARWGEAVETAPIIRSVRVRRRMLCQEQPDPPAGTFAAREQKLAELSELLQDPTTTNQLKYHRLTEDEPCTNCHLQYINPLGFGMEDFDTVGNVRSQDLNGNMIDAMGDLYAPNDYNNVDEVESFAGTRDLGQVLTTLPAAQACISKQMFRYVMGVGYDSIDNDNPEGPALSDEEKTGYACEIENLTQSMMDDNPRAMLERFSTLEAVRYRKAWSRD